MSSEKLLKHLRELGVRLWTEEGKLRFQATKGSLTPDLRSELGRRKAEIISFLEEARQAALAAEAPPLVPVERRPGETPPASFAQQRLWFLDQLAPGPAYNQPAAFRVSGPLDVVALRRSLGEIVRRHEVLRTRFATQDGKPVQVISESADLPWRVVDLADLEPERREAGLRYVARTVAKRLFDLGRGLLVRAVLLRLGAAEHVVVLSLHHVVFDGWSVGVLRRELMDLYGAFSSGRAPRLPELPVQYADFAVWQRRWLDGQRLTREVDWWRRQLQGAPARLELPTDRPRPAFPSSSGRLHRVALPRELTGAFDEWARGNEATLFMALLAVFQVLLHRHSGQTDVVVGSPIAGRDRPEIAGLIGFFVNTLALRVDLVGDPSFGELLARVRGTTLAAYTHPSLPFEKLVEELHPERSLSHNPLFQVAFALNVRHPEVAISGLLLQALPVHTDTSIVDLTLLLEEDPAGGVRGFWEYSAELFDATTVARLDGHYREVLAAAVARPEARISTLGLLTPGERFQLLEEWNATPGSAVPEGVHRLVAKQAERTPAATALVDGDRRMSYRELQERSSQLAHRLRRLGVGPEARLVLLFERSAELVVAALGVWKAGGAYVPLDPGLPEARLVYLVADSGARVVLTRERWPETAGERLVVDLDAWAFGDESPEAPENVASSSSLAYVVYTSGSTGEPKGVEVEHAALSNLVAWHQSAYGTGPGVRTTLVAGPGFDASVWETWPALVSGASLHVADAATVASVPDLVSWLASEEIRQCFLPTPLAEEVLRSPWPAEAPLQVLLTGGDRLRRGGRADVPWRLVNHYGPTENAVVTTWTPAASGETAPPIGRPLPGVRVYVLDRHLRPVPMGASGELSAGGASLARGYLGRPGLTAERFVPDPFAKDPGGRLYRTGDLVRCRADGQIDFLGRIDFQVKVRGFRIELGEVEAALLGHESVAEAVVLALPGVGDEKRLVAYVVPAVDAVLDLRGYLEERLPSYMVPSAFVTLEALPLTPNGKVDRAALGRKALPRPEGSSGEAVVAPRTELEKRLAEVWGRFLEVEEIGVHQSFFDLGGHSLLASRVARKLEEELRRPVSVAELFEHPTVASLARSLAPKPDDPSAVGPRLAPVPRDRDLPLSFAQQRLWLLNRMEPANTSYNLPAAVLVQGSLDVAALRGSLDELVRRHETLRTRFAEGEEGPVQVVDPARAQALPAIDLSSLDGRRREREWRRLAAAEAAHVFDLERGPLLRTALLKLDDAGHVLLLHQHHVVSDGWSIGHLIREIGASYRALAAGEAPRLPELPVQYADFAVWQRQWLQGEVLERQLTYWRRQLAGVPVLDLPTDRPRPPVFSGRGARRPFELPRPLVAGLEELARGHAATLYMVLLAAFRVLLSGRTGQSDFGVGSPVDGRRHPAVEALIGFFVNTLTLRDRVPHAGVSSFADLLVKVRETAVTALANQDLPFEKLIEELRAKRDRSRSPLFQVMLSLQTAPAEPLELPGLVLSPLSFDNGTAKFDLLVDLVPRDGGLVGSIEYATDLFDSTTALRLVRSFKILLTSIVDRPRGRISELHLLERSERQQVAFEWNDTRFLYADRDLCLHRLIEAQAQRTPDAVASLFEGDLLTYRELDRRSNQLARYLQSRGVRNEELVGLFAERSLEVIVGLLAILKAGGAYLPLDPGYPPDRVAFMMQDAGISVLLTQDHLAGRVPGGGKVHLVRLDGDWETIAREDDAPCPEVATPDSLAYTIYTSGSTGRPKGAMNTHRAIVNRLLWMQEAFGLTAEDRVLQKTPMSFDVSVWELFWPLMYGARQVFARPEGHKDGAYLVSLIEAEGITTLHFVPSMLAAFLEEPDVERCRGLVRVICSGEALSLDLQRRFQSRLPARLENLYGPTEAAVDVTFWACERRVRRSTVPIGRPILNTEIRILDRHLRLVPVGVPGELAIGGVQLARGYHRRPALTAEKLVPDPFGARQGGRLYRTGDLSRTLSDGNVDYLGRLDHQVKIRGLRIELGEVEAALAAHPAVREAVVLTQDRGGDPRLVAFLVVDEGDAGTDVVEAVRRAAAARLPDYMVPSVLSRLDSLPLLPNGKVDRRALAGLVPETAPRHGAARYVAPRSPIEEALAEVWAEVLGIEKVGVHDDFFELGGHSLLATRVVSRMRRTMNVEVTLAELFEAPTIAALAPAFAGSETPAAMGDTLPLLEVPRVLGEPLPLSFSQLRLWFLEQFEPGTAAFNMPHVVRLTGSLDAIALHRSLEEVVRRHEALRTTFTAVDGEPAQVIAARLELPLPRVDLSRLPGSRRWRRTLELAASAAAEPFDITRGPLLRAMLIRLGEAEHLFTFTIHHIVFDGWSQGVFLQEIQLLYEAFRAGVPSPLPAPAFHYADFAVWQRRRLQGEALESLVAYWRRHLADVPPVLRLPTDRPRPPVRSERGAKLPVRFSRSHSQSLKQFRVRQGTTAFIVLLAAAKALLYRYTGQHDLSVGTFIANRNQAELESLIGFFVNTLVLRTNLAGDPAFPDLLGRVREVALGAYAHQDLPFEKLLEELQVEREMSVSPLFQVALVFQNAPAPTLEPSGLTAEVVEIPGLSWANFDWTLWLWEEGSDLVGLADYKTDLFDATTMWRFVRHYESLLAGLLAAPETRLSEISFLSPAECHQLLEAWNDTEVDRGEEGWVHERIASWAERDPERPAVLFEDRLLSYGELDRLAGRLAGRLARRSVGRTAGSPEVVVAILAERSVEMVVAAYAVLKAGGAYLPLDITHARDRIAHLLEVAGVPLLLTTGDLASELPELACEVMTIDAEDASETPPTAVRVHAENLAYVVYTSGSTGRPKGVMVTHGAWRNAYLAWEESYALRPEGCHLQMASFSFDVFAGDFVRALCSGGRLVVCPRETLLEAPALYSLMQRHGVDGAEFVPAVARHLVQHLKESGKRLDFLRHLVVGSDVWYVREYRQLRSFAGPETRTINSYGLSEVTIDSTFFEGEARSLHDDAQVPIGRPFGGTRVYVLDRGLRIVAVGVAGELCLGGLGLARGYYGQAGMTAEKYSPDPLSGQPGARIYRTGDQARYRPDGHVDFLGRVDKQVKIRGFRIEPAEVEAVLGEHPSVEEAVVLARVDPPGGARLVAYVVAASADVVELRRFLKEKVPDYMVPSAFVSLEALPLTSNGKVDRRRLPAPSADAVDVRPASTVTEKVLVEIFQEVLGVEPVGVETDFFAVGGHSLLATQVVSRVRERLCVELPLRVLFELPVLGELAAAIDAAESGEAADLDIPRRPAGSAAELSFAQQRLWVLDQLEPGSAAYNIPNALVLEGSLDVSALFTALEEVVRRHETLRTTFTTEGEEPIQVVGSPAFSLPLLDLRRLPEARREVELRRRIGEEANRPFDLGRGPVFRTLLLRLEPVRHALVLNMHHICSDAWSMGIFIQEMGTLYAAALRGSVHGVLPGLPIQYADFAVWQRQWLVGEGLERQLAYWREQLAGLTPLELPSDRPRPPLWSGRGRSVPVTIPSALREGLEAMGRERGATLFMTLLGAFQTWLARETGRRDVAVGSPIAGRRLRQVESLIGFFVNTLALRGQISPRLRWEEFLGRTRAVTLAAFEHQDLPFEKLVEALQPERDRGRSPLVQAVLVLQNAPRSALLQVPGLHFRPLEAESATAKFDLTLTLWEGPSLVGSLEYATDLFDRATVERWMRRFAALLQDVAENPGKPLADLSLLLPSERWQLLGEWSGVPATESSVTIDALFSQQVKRTPKAVALTWDGGEMSYGDLDRRSNQLARHLRASLAPEGLMGLFMDRAPEMIVAKLGILKAGGAYAPLDPGLPEARLALLLEDTRVGVVLTQGHLASRLPAGTPVLCLDEDWEAVAKQKATPPPAATTPHHLAYVMYTSGTTGRPKGVAVPHRAVVRLVRETGYASFGPDEVFLQLAPVSFDAATLEVWGPLLNGGRLVLHPPGPLSLDEVARSIEEHGVTTLWLTAGLFHQMVEAHPESLARVRQVLAGGDVLSPSRVRALLERSEGRLINGYGPTENTTFTCCHGMRRSADVGVTVSIGRPIASTTVYLLDCSLSPVGVGTFGELYTGGEGLARGYFGRPGATAESFVPDPWTPGGRLYKTGDLARFLPDGTVEFQGRADQQVKLRGYRIELGEIEATLASHEDVAEAVVTAREDSGDKRLVAYVVLTPGGEVDPLRSFLAERLPGYMVPAAFVVLEELPLTPNGKVDRRALPAPEVRDVGERYVAPATPVQEVLATMWAEAFGLQRVGVNDDFFELGGHSLLATRLVSRLNKIFRIQLGVSKVFDATTVAMMERALIENEPRPGQMEKVARLLLKIRQTPAGETSPPAGEERPSAAEPVRTERPAAGPVTVAEPPRTQLLGEIP